MDYSPWGRKASNMTEQLSCVPDPEIVLKRPCLKAECRKEQSDVLWGEEGTSRWLVCIQKKKKKKPVFLFVAKFCKPFL